MEASELNSTQMVPIVGAGEGSALVGRGVYFFSMVVVGRAEKFIFLRLLKVVSVSQPGGLNWQDILGPTTGIGKFFTELVEGDADFLL